MTTYPGSREHHETSRRAWCGCGEWCYFPNVEMSCSCCREALADANPCPHCHGTGIATPEGDDTP